MMDQVDSRTSEQRSNESQQDRTKNDEKKNTKADTSPRDPVGMGTSRQAPNAPSENSSSSVLGPTSAPSPGEPDHEDEEKDSTSDDSSPQQAEEDEEEDEEEGENEQQMNEEQRLKTKRQHEKRLAMNRASARERRKRKRLLIEELQERVQLLASSNITLRRIGEERRHQLSQVCAVLTATQPAVASTIIAGNENGVPVINEAAANAVILAAQQGTGAGALASLQQQEAVRALLEAQQASSALASAAAMPSVPPALGANELAHELQQQRHRALLAQQMGDAVGGANASLLAGIVGGRATAASHPVASLFQGQLVGPGFDAASAPLPRQALSGPVSTLHSTRSTQADSSQGQTALELLRRARAAGTLSDESSSGKPDKDREES